MRIVWQLLMASLKEIARNKAAIFWMVAFPLMFIVIFGLVFGNEDFPPLDVGLAQEEQTVVTKPLVEGLAQVPVFDLLEGEADDLRRQVESGSLQAMVRIPAGFTDAVMQGQSAELEVVYDPAQTTTSNIVRSVMQSMIQEVNYSITQTEPVVRISEQSVQVEKTRQVDWLVPGILGMAIMQLGLFSSAAFVTLREKKIFRRFAVTPVGRHHMIISQVLFRLIFGLLQSLVLLTAGYLIFGVTIEGSILLLAGVVMLATMMFLAMGYIIASLAKNEEVVEPLVQVFAMPMMFFSGVFFPVALMPEFLQPVVQALPLTYLNESLRGVINNAATFTDIAGAMGMMTVWLVGSMVVAVKVFRWE